jgi:prepilin-type N-terminal cleavage/methylation domain-containing protein
MNHPHLQHLPRSATRAAGCRRAFTLVELLVALAAVALLAIGIAEVFRLTGKTVSAGRRLSNITAYAGLLERQLRADFATMTRDGFLVIRNDGADANGNGRYDRDVIDASGTTRGADRVPLSPSDDSGGRTRRTDSITFFATGRFATARDARHPDAIARGSAARIYYGHGARQSPTASNYLVPRADDQFANNGDDVRMLPLGRRATDGTPSPNQYASDWVLLRHVTVLAPPRSSEQSGLTKPTPIVPFSSPDRWQDNLIQASLQPAAPSIFRKMIDLVDQDRSLLPPANQLMRLPPQGRGGQSIEIPRFSSGIVDIAATDLPEVRAVVLGAPDPTNISPAEFSARFPIALGTQQLQDEAVRRMQRWMIQGQPTDMDGTDPNNGVGAINADLARRIRFEPTPPNYLGLPDPAVQRDYERSDQAMLSASAFVPRCTEFIVEWSYGQVRGNPIFPDAGQTVWYGMTREFDIDGDEQLDLPPTGVDYAIGPYDGTMTQRVALNDSSEFTRAVAASLIHPPRATGAAGSESPLYSCFGYIDPTYKPSTAPNGILFDALPTVVGGRNSRTYEATDGDQLNSPDTVPWMWPTLIRITVTIADQADPPVERTFQFILPTPGNKPGASF